MGSGWGLSCTVECVTSGGPLFLSAKGGGLSRVFSPRWGSRIWATFTGEPLLGTLVLPSVALSVPPLLPPCFPLGIMQSVSTSSSVSD